MSASEINSNEDNGESRENSEDEIEQGDQIVRKRIPSEGLIQRPWRWMGPNGGR